ncbi:MAG: hypothetical protein Q8N96_06830 [Methylovulum sp.]|nr:hypothetical protein [Methylovulum sp.]
MKLVTNSPNLRYLLLGVLLYSYGGATKSLELPQTFPIAMTFRAFDNMKVGTEAFNKRLEEQEPFSWIHAPGFGDKAKSIHARWPKKITTLQYGYGGITGDYFSKVWPGHLLYKTGSVINRDINPQDKIIQIQDYKRIAPNNKRVKLINKFFPFSLIIYALDSAGKPDWSQSEHIIVDSLEGGKLIVQRGQWGSKPLSFKAGKAVVAAHMMFWTKQWQLNFSLHSPRGGIGNLTAQEWFSREMAKKIQEANADGIEFDVGRWTWGKPENNPMDIDNNLAADYGYIDGVNSFGLGGQVFFRELRKLLGPDKIIQADSNGAMFGVRGWHYLNGIQLESFPSNNDFNRFSEAFLHLRLWADNAEASPRASYPFTKTPTTVFANDRLPKGEKTDFRFRIGLASACLTGMPHPFASLYDISFDPENPKKQQKKETGQMGVFKWDEYHGGDLNNWHWLGRPSGLLTQDLTGLNKADLLAGATWQWSVNSGIIAEHSVMKGLFSANVKKIPSGTLPENAWNATHLEVKGAGLRNLVPGHEYTLEFDARGDDNWHYAGQTFDRLPRMVAINGAIAANSDKPMSVLVDSSWRTYRISFIANASHAPTPIFGVAEQVGKTEIRNIKLYAGGAERWSREFENGLVLLNMTSDPWRATVRKGYYNRLKGPQAPEINNGQPVENEVIIPARDALFLIKR